MIGAVLLSGCASIGGHTPTVETSTRPARGTSVQAVATSDGVRRFVLHVPKESGTQAAYPLLLLLHGSNSEGSVIEEQSAMDSVADRYQVVVAYPDGARSIFGRATADWNAGDCCGYAMRKGIDDVGFLRAIIENLSGRLPIDQRRVYAGGFSDGGRMAYRAACDLGDRLAAIAVVSGSLQLGGCHPSRPVSLIAIHGTADDEVPYADEVPGSVRMSGPPGASAVPPSVRYWSRLDGCTSYAERRLAVRVVRGDFGGCVGGAVSVVTLDGGTHGWPDASSSTDGAAAMHQLAASELILRFLLDHGR